MYKIIAKDINNNILHEQEIKFKENFNYMILDFIDDLKDDITSFEGDVEDVYKVSVITIDDDYEEEMDSILIEEVENYELSRKMDEDYTEEEL